MRSFYLLLKHEFNLHFPRWYSLVVQVVVVVVTLLGYWYFSQAIEPSAQFQADMPEGYFFYLVVGELSLLWPSLFVSHPARLVKQFYYKQSLDSLLVLREKAALVLIKMTGGQVLIQSLKYIFYVVALLALSEQIKLFNLLYFFVLQALFLPLFMTVGVLSSCMVVYFGRGEKIIQVVVNASYVMAGVYFPVKVFPEFIQDIFSVSPFNELISQSRNILSMGAIDWSFFASSLNFFACGLLCFFSSLQLLKFILKRCDRPINHYPLVY